MVRYANSLKLRLAMRIAEVKPDLAREKAVGAIAGGVITANADNAAMHAAENRTTLIYNDWGDHRVGADIICYMNGYNDPRLEKMFLPNDVGDYVGIRIGIDVAGKATAMSKYSNMIVASDPLFMVQRRGGDVPACRIRAALGVGRDGEELYEEAVRLSFEERGASGADAYLADAAKPSGRLYRSAGHVQRSGAEHDHSRVGATELTRPFRSATSNASSRRSGSLSSRWAWRRGPSTAARAIRG